MAERHSHDDNEEAESGIGMLILSNLGVSPLAPIPLPTMHAHVQTRRTTEQMCVSDDVHRGFVSCMLTVSTFSQISLHFIYLNCRQGLVDETIYSL